MSQINVRYCHGFIVIVIEYYLCQLCITGNHYLQLRPVAILILIASSNNLFV